MGSALWETGPESTICEHVFNTHNAFTERQLPELSTIVDSLLLLLFE